MRIKIYGHGWVGRSVGRLFKNSIIVDPIYSHYPSSKDKDADVAFVCVPTPLKNGSLDLTLVDDVIREAEEPLIIVRSTVIPGFCDAVEKDYGKAVVYQPEYLGETVAHPLFDESHVPFLILGGSPENRRQVIDLYQTVYNANVRIRQVTNYEAEIIKLSENRAIGMKIGQVQELFDVCQKAGVDFNTIREAVFGDDPRFNLWFTFVYPDKRGFNSKCLPKDIYGFCAWAESIGAEVPLTRELLAYNETLIREQVHA